MHVPNEVKDIIETIDSLMLALGYREELVVGVSSEKRK